MRRPKCWLATASCGSEPLTWVAPVFAGCPGGGRARYRRSGISTPVFAAWQCFPMSFAAADQSWWGFAARAARWAAGRVLRRYLLLALAAFDGNANPLYAAQHAQLGHAQFHPG